MWKKLDDVPPAVLKAYEEGSWSMRPPPVCTAQWDKLAWINHIFGGEPHFLAVAAKARRAKGAA